MVSQIKRWEARIDEMDTSKGVSNKMIQAAMRAEIKELRLHVSASNRVLTTARAQRDEWRRKATQYQRELIQLLSP